MLVNIFTQQSTLVCHVDFFVAHVPLTALSRSNRTNDYITAQEPLAAYNNRHTVTTLSTAARQVNQLLLQDSALAA